MVLAFAIEPCPTIATTVQRSGDGQIAALFLAPFSGHLGDCYLATTTCRKPPPCKLPSLQLLITARRAVELQRERSLLPRTPTPTLAVVLRGTESRVRLQRRHQWPALSFVAQLPLEYRILAHCLRSEEEKETEVIACQRTYRSHLLEWVKKLQRPRIIGTLQSLPPNISIACFVKLRNSLHHRHLYHWCPCRPTQLH